MAEVGVHDESAKTNKCAIPKIKGSEAIRLTSRSTGIVSTRIASWQNGTRHRVRAKDFPFQIGWLAYSGARDGYPRFGRNSKAKASAAQCAAPVSSPSNASISIPASVFGGKVTIAANKKSK
ncbi:MAG: hypothetical protein ACK53Y_17135 [bacterium]